MRIVLVCDALTTGGAETFILRLGGALSASGNDLSIFVLRGELTNHLLCQSIAPDLPVVAVRVPYLSLVLKFDGLLFRLRSSFSLLRWMQVRQLRSFLRALGAEVAHSHLLTADLVTARACTAEAVPWVTTMHGDYLAFEARDRIQAARIQSFQDTMREIEQSVCHLATISKQQSDQLSRLMPRAANAARISRIYNGYAAPAGTCIPSELPDALKAIPTGGFVIGMVGRGFREKGWDVLVAAFLALALPNAWLVLVGDGDYLSGLRVTTQHAQIIFTGNVVDPLRYIARFDVGCLPSRYKAESLPTVVIEYMILGKPVIASDIGELSAMLDMESDAPAGLLVELDSVEEMAKQMKTALRRIHDDATLRQFLQTNSVKAVRKFDMNKCVDKYLAVYKEVT